MALSVGAIVTFNSNEKYKSMEERIAVLIMKLLEMQNQVLLNSFKLVV